MRHDKLHVYADRCRPMNYVFYTNYLMIKYVDFSHNHTNLVKLIVSMNAISNEVIFSCKVDCKLECYFQPGIGFL